MRQQTGQSLDGLLCCCADRPAGKVDIRLPFPPGVEYDYMAEPPSGSVPIRFNESFVVENDILKQAEYILSDKVVGVETVAVAPDGSLGIVDKFGKVC